MANDKSNAAPETALPAIDPTGTSGVRSTAFDQLIDWILEHEENNPDLRIKAIVVAEQRPFEDFSITYGRPLIEQGAAYGYKKTDGGFFAMPLGN